MKNGLILAALVFLTATAFTPATPVFQDGNCPSAPVRLKQADIAVVTVGDGETLNLRVFPGLKQEIIVKIPAYTYVTIIAGPICDGGYRWFEVGWEGKDGWSAEVGPDGEYNMIPNGDPIPDNDEVPGIPNETDYWGPQHDCESCTIDPCFLFDIVKVENEMYIPLVELRRIPNLETLDAMEIPRCAVQAWNPEKWGNEWPPSGWEIGQDIPNIITDPYGFCIFYWSDFNPREGSLSDLCKESPGIPSEIPQTPQPLVEAPIETTEEEDSNWFCSNLGMFCPVLAAEKPEFPKSPRPAFNDGLPGVQCTEYVQDIRPDALCWLEQPANGNLWAKQLLPNESNYLGITHDDNPKVGDIAVWESNCSSIKNHVGIVVADTSGRCKSDQVAVADANHNEDGKIYDGNKYTCYAVNASCMEFIHQSTKHLDSSTCTVIPPYCDQFKGLRKIWCNLTGK